jgi:hypothetical protein
VTWGLGRSARASSKSTTSAGCSCRTTVPAGRCLDVAPVQSWLDAGISVATIRSVVSRLAGRRSYDPGRVNTWAFFQPGIQEALAQRASLGGMGSTEAAAPLASTVLDEDGAKAGLGLAQQAKIRDWKTRRQAGGDTTVIEQIMPDDVRRVVERLKMADSTGSHELRQQRQA